MKRSWSVRLADLLAAITMLVTLSALTASSHAADLANHVSYAGHAVVRATVLDEAQLARLLSICPKVHSCHIGVGAVDVIADKKQQRLLREAGIRYDVRIQDLQPMIDAERARLEAAEAGGVAGGSFFDDFKPYADIMAQLDAIAAAHPQLAQVLSVGTSAEGRDIKAIRISGTPTVKPGVLITGCQHAREWISPMTAMFIVDALVNGYASDPEIQQLLLTIEFYIIPIVNPDGYVYSWGPDRFWRKNRNLNFDGTVGVDLNRNWAIGFAGEGTSPDPGSDVYPGVKAFSEPETLALYSFVIARPTIRACLDLHSYSQIVLQPWSHTNDRPATYPCIDEIGDAMSTCIHDVHGEHYPHASGSGVIYLAGGTIHDWMFGDQGMLAYNIELRPDTSSPGFILPAEEIVPTGEEVVPAVMALADAALMPAYAAFPLGEPEFVQAGQINAVDLAVMPIAASAVNVGTEKLFARIGTSGPFTQSSLVWVNDLSYQVLLPAAPCGEVIQFYFEMQLNNQAVVTIPPTAAEYFEAKARDIDTVHHDDMEVDTGWTVGAPGDDAATGIWTRGAPTQTWNGWTVVAQPGMDNPAGSGTLCWYTGAEGGPFAGGNDVDGGTTTLTSPMLDASAAGDAYISYYRWYSNHTGSNPHSETMPIEISDDGGQTWTLLELVEENETKWTHRMFRIADFVAPTSTLRVRFVARDLTKNGGAIVEAAIDDLRIIHIGCDAPPCLGDIATSATFQPPGDGQVNAADLAYLLGAWGVNAGSPADLVTTATFAPPPDGIVDAADLAVLLGAWGGCG